MVKDQRKEVREDFLNNFFIPAREAYEKNINKYIALFPIKEADLEPKPAKYNNIFAFKETISSRKIDGFM